MYRNVEAIEVKSFSSVPFFFLLALNCDLGLMHHLHNQQLFLLRPSPRMMWHHPSKSPPFGVVEVHVMDCSISDDVSSAPTTDNLHQTLVGI